MSPLKQRDIAEQFVEICKSCKKGNLEISRRHCRFENEYPADLPFCIELYQKSYKILEQCDQPAFEVVGTF